MKKFLQEFKEFAFKGNIVDLAVAVVMGGAFSAVIAGFVSHIVSPIIAAITGQVSLSTITLGVIRIGSFIDVLINFVITAFAIFVALKTFNTLQKKRAEEEPAPVVVDRHLETLKEILAELKNK